MIRFYCRTFKPRWQRPSAWLALFAVLVQALLPALVHAAAPQTLEICTAYGIQKIAFKNNGVDVATQAAPTALTQQAGSQFSSVLVVSDTPAQVVSEALPNTPAQAFDKTHCPFCALTHAPMLLGDSAWGLPQAAPALLFASAFISPIALPTLYSHAAPRAPPAVL